MALNGNVTLRLADGSFDVHRGACENWTLNLIETGLTTSTGGRVKRLQSLLGSEPFMLTYGDGLANVDLHELVRFHERCGTLATITAVRPPSRFGGLEFDGEHVSKFIEKSQMGEGWINGGFMVLEPAIFEYLTGDDVVLETGLLEKLSERKQLGAYRHLGFWQCMDTLRDVRLLGQLWETNAPWKVWG